MSVRIKPITDKKQLKLLRLFYLNAAEKIIKSINEAPSLTTVEARTKVLHEVDGILSELDEKSAAWFTREVERGYKRGSNLAFAMLRDVGVDSVISNFGRIDKQAVKVMVDDAFINYGSGITGIGKSVNQLMTIAEKETIQAILTEGRITGETRRQISDKIAGELKKGYIGLQDRGGKVWDPEVYSRMLARTKYVEATNRGMMNGLLKNDYDLVQVSRHNSKHAECAYWEGKILSISGRTKGYPTYNDAVAAGLFHPNCEHRIYPYDDTFASASDRWVTAKLNGQAVV